MLADDVMSLCSDLVQVSLYTGHQIYTLYGGNFVIVKSHLKNALKSQIKMNK